MSPAQSPFFQVLSANKNVFNTPFALRDFVGVSDIESPALTLRHTGEITKVNFKADE